ncbi:MAG: DUF305 domain-containing protein [Bacteroidota bacterium]
MITKIKLLLIATVCLYGFNACNSNTSTSTDSDTTITGTEQNDARDTMSANNHTMHDTGSAGNPFMKSMHDHMAQMQKMQVTGDFDIDFSNMMIHHHQGAIDMAEVEVAQGSDEKLKALAQKIITGQKEDQDKLRTFINDYKPSGMKHGEGALQKSMNDMMGKMPTMQMSGNTDKDFASMMAIHHQHGIDMGKMELEHGMSKALKQMTQKEMDKQQKEIAELKAWLASNK